MRACRSRRYPDSRSGGTAESSQPGQACRPSAIRVAMPAPLRRMDQIAAVCSASAVMKLVASVSRARRSALAIASASSVPSISQYSQASPRGSRSMPGARPPRERSASTSGASRPSTVSAPAFASEGAQSAAA